MRSSHLSRTDTIPSLDQMKNTDVLAHGRFKYATTQGGGFTITGFEGMHEFRKPSLFDMDVNKLLLYRTEKALNLRGSLVAALARENFDAEDEEVVKNVSRLAVKLAKQAAKGGLDMKELNWGNVRDKDGMQDPAFERASRNLKALLSSSSSKTVSFQKALPVLRQLEHVLHAKAGAVEGSKSVNGADTSEAASARFDALSQRAQALALVGRALTGGAMKIQGDTTGTARRHVARAWESADRQFDKLSPGYEAGVSTDAIKGLNLTDHPLVVAAIREFKMDLVVQKSLFTEAEVASAKDFNARGIQVVWLQAIVATLTGARGAIEARAFRGGGNTIKPTVVTPHQPAAGAEDDPAVVKTKLGQLNAQLLARVNRVQEFRSGAIDLTASEYRLIIESIDMLMAEIDSLELYLRRADTATTTTTTTATVPGSTSTTTSTATTTTTATTPITTTTTNATRSGNTSASNT